MPVSEKIRIDKFLWAVRLFKTRSLASDACRKGWVIINKIQVKPSHTVTEGEIINLKKPPAIFAYKVTGLTGNRLPARLVNEYITDLTPDEEKTRIMVSRNTGQGIRPRGLGRPTKKERRSIEKYRKGITDL